MYIYRGIYMGVGVFIYPIMWIFLRRRREEKRENKYYIFGCSSSLLGVGVGVDLNPWRCVAPPPSWRVVRSSSLLFLGGSHQNEPFDGLRPPFLHLLEGIEGVGGGYCQASTYICSRKNFFHIFQKFYFFLKIVYFGHILYSWN